MTILDDQLTNNALDTEAGPADLQLGNVADRIGAPKARIDELEAFEDEDETGPPPVSLMSASIAAFLATAGAGWMLGGIFVGTMPRLLGVLGALVGAGTVALSSRFRNPTTIQFLALPLGIVIGLAMTAAVAAGSSVPTLIVDAVKAGGLSQPPVPFDPGWRFLLVVLTCSIAISAATGAVAFNRARLAVFLPAPVIVAGVLIQPEGKELISVLPALVLLVAGLAVAFGGELSRDSETGASFEARRLGKAAGFLLIVVAVMGGMSQLGFLFPPKQDSTVIPPKRPQTPPPLTTDKVLFSIKQKEPAPLRLGVLDGYDGTAWLTPPYDPKRFVDVTSTNLPSFTPDRPSSEAKLQPLATPKKSVEVEIRIEEPGPGREIPDLANTFAVTGAPEGTQFDPRAQTLRLPGRGKRGATYTVRAAVPPDAAALSAGKTPGAIYKPFVEVPPPPPAVRALLAGVPANLSAYERLQAVRTAFYSKITAKGPGNPVDLLPARVDEFLTGTPATPYEITAAEVLMARWAGMPARIGYGYYNPDAKPTKDGRVEVRQSDGAMWLEAHFEGTGWTPILGKPPKAQASLDQNKKKNKQVLPNGLISAQLYIPIKQQGLTLLYTIVQFWLVRVLALAAVGFFFWILLPGMLKSIRRWRRRRWAMEAGPQARLAVAYAELRDRAIDFNIGHPTLTPLQFLDVLEPDDDHTQLAWVVTRGLWGDLARDLRVEDVEVAEQWARQLYRRFNGAQPYLMRMLAFGSRVSLRDPWSREIPNLYYRRGPVALLVAGFRAVTSRVRMRTLTPALGRAAMVLMAMTMLSGCVQQIDLSDAAAGQSAPLPAVPAKLGDFAFEQTSLGDKQFEQYRDIALISDYDLFAVRRAGVAVGTLQTATFKPGLRSRNKPVREGVLSSLGGRPEVSRIGGETFYTISVNELRLLVWFAPDGLTYQLLAATKDLDRPGDLFARLVAAEQGKSDTESTIEQGAPPSDVRRGRL